jgi:hypothetical protein
MSRVIREELKGLLPDHKEHSMRLRFNAAIFEWLQIRETGNSKTSAALLNRFDFNNKYPLSSRLKNFPVTEWLAENKLRIKITALEIPSDIIAPVGTTKVYLKIAVTGCSLDRMTPVKLQESVIEVDYLPGTTGSQNIDWDIDTENALMLIVVGLRYEVDGVVNDDLRWRPVGVVGTNREV